MEPAQFMKGTEMGAAFRQQVNRSERIFAIADEHRHLADQVEVICLVAERNPKDKTSLVASIQDLVKLSRTHFRHEETMMRATSYPGTLMHARDHDYLIKTLVDFTAAVVDDTVEVTPEFCNGLRSWLNFHTRKYDESYREFEAGRSDAPLASLDIMPSLDRPPSDAARRSQVARS